MAQAMRSEPIARLAKLLDAAGTGTPWEVIERSLLRMPVKVLNALVYRVERARGEAYDDGVARSDVRLP